MSTEDLEAALPSLRASVTKSRAASDEWPLLKPDWQLPRRLFCVRKVETWLNTTHISVLAMNRGRDTSQWVSIIAGFRVVFLTS